MSQKLHIQRGRNYHYHCPYVNGTYKVIQDPYRLSSQLLIFRVESVERMLDVR